MTRKDVVWMAAIYFVKWDEHSFSSISDIMGQCPIKLDFGIRILLHCKGIKLIIMKMKKWFGIQQTLQQCGIAWNCPGR